MVVDNRSSGSDGTDTLTSIETLRFADQDVDITDWTNLDRDIICR